MKIAIASDHGGYEVKKKIISFLEEKKIIVEDLGTDSTESVNYAEFGIKCALKVSNNLVDYGVVVCTSGEGISIAANKVKNIRCGIAYNDEVTKFMRLHNDCNMISFGAKYMNIDDILRRLDIFLSTPFEGGRHVKRVETITNYENL